MSTEVAANAPAGLASRALAAVWDFFATVVKLVYADLVKLSRYWVVLMGYIAMMALALIGAYLSHYVEQSVKIQSGSGYAFAVSLMIRCIDFGVPIIYVMTCILFSMEVSAHTIKYLLVRPITRLQLIVSKYVTALLMFAAAVAIFWVIALLTGHYYYGLGDLVENEYLIFKATYMFKEMLIGSLFLMVPCLAIASMAVAVSTYSSTMGGSIIVGLILWIFFQILGILPKSMGVHFTFRGEELMIPYISIGFPSQRFLPFYMLDNLATGLEVSTWWTQDVAIMIVICGAYFSLFFLISVIGVLRRDFTL